MKVYDARELTVEQGIPLTNAKLFYLNDGVRALLVDPDSTPEIATVGSVHRLMECDLLDYLAQRDEKQQELITHFCRAPSEESGRMALLHWTMKTHTDHSHRTLDICGIEEGVMLLGTWLGAPALSRFSSHGPQLAEEKPVGLLAILGDGARLTWRTYTQIGRALLRATFRASNTNGIVRIEAVNGPDRK